MWVPTGIPHFPTPVGDLQHNHQRVLADQRRIVLSKPAAATDNRWRTAPACGAAGRRPRLRPEAYGSSKEEWVGGAGQLLPVLGWAGKSAPELWGVEPAVFGEKGEEEGRLRGSCGAGQLLPVLGWAGQGAPELLRCREGRGQVFVCVGGKVRVGVKGVAILRMLKDKGSQTLWVQKALYWHGTTLSPKPASQPFRPSPSPT